METDRFISLIRPPPPVREFIDRVAAEETGDIPGSIMIECEMVDNVPLDVAETAMHPHDNDQFIIQDLRVEQFSDAALSAILTYEGFISGLVKPRIECKGYCIQH